LLKWNFLIRHILLPTVYNVIFWNQITWFTYTISISRPKLGPVNLNVIDAVEARMAAAGNNQLVDDADPAGGQASPAFNRLRCRSVDAKRELFRNLRIETSLENASDQQQQLVPGTPATPGKPDQHLQVGQRNRAEDSSATGQKLLKTTRWHCANF